MLEFMIFVLLSGLVLKLKDCGGVRGNRKDLWNFFDEILAGDLILPPFATRRGTVNADAGPTLISFRFKITLLRFPLHLLP
jgi:hypothetical protein